MSGNDVAQEVKQGLADAANGLGGGGVIVELEVLSGGSNDPIFPVEPVIEYEELVNCAFTAVTTKQIDGTLIKAGDIAFTADGEINIEVGDTMRRGGKSYNVETCDAVSPFGVVVAFQGTARAQ